MLYRYETVLAYLKLLQFYPLHSVYCFRREATKTNFILQIDLFRCCFLAWQMLRRKTGTAGGKGGTQGMNRKLVNKTV